MGIISVDIAAREVDHSEGLSSRRWVGILVAFVVFLGLIVFVLHTTTRMNVKDLFVDPSAKAELGSHVGLFSHLGVLALWSGATALVGAALVGRGGNDRRFLLSLGGLLAWLAIDDLYLVHEEMGGVLSHYVMPSIDRRVLEGVIFAAYGLAWIAWLAWYRRALLGGPAILLALALAALGGSVAIDVGEIFIEEWVRLDESRNTAFTVIEELLKLGGILLLASYAIAVARERAQRGLRPLPGRFGIDA